MYSRHSTAKHRRHTVKILAHVISYIRQSVVSRANRKKKKKRATNLFQISYNNRVKMFQCPSPPASTQLPTCREARQQLQHDFAERDTCSALASRGTKRVRIASPQQPRHGRGAGAAWARHRDRRRGGRALSHIVCEPRGSSRNDVSRITLYPRVMHKFFNRLYNNEKCVWMGKNSPVSSRKMKGWLFRRRVFHCVIILR